LIERVQLIDDWDTAKAVWYRKTARGSFSEFHYDKKLSATASKCYLVEITGYGYIGFIASCRRRGRFGSDPRPMWYAHKTAIRLPNDDPDYLRLWALVADEQARMNIALGRRFVCMAPIDHAAYRDLPNSGWEPAAQDKQHMKDGYRSHRYVGAAKAMAASAGLESIWHS
jgi:hypothetical protein